MANTRSYVAAIRYGYGLRPGQVPADGPEGLLAQLRRDDPYLGAAGVPSIGDRIRIATDYAAARKMKRKKMDGAAEEIETQKRVFRRMVLDDGKRLVIRPLESPDGFRERLLRFWTDHFTVRASLNPRGALVHDMINSAIRPNLAGSFPDMLVAVSKHPAMLVYLNQVKSAGPNSELAGKRKRGLNENLAREILELHTLGVGAEYTQTDVRQFAELLTGMTFDKSGFTFRAKMAEPGAEKVLGRTYGDKGKAKLADVEKALRDIALREDTALHLAGKLIVHFIGGTPAEDHKRAIARAYLASGGGLLPAYRAMLEDDRAWALPFNKAKLPFDFVVSSLRAMEVSGKVISGLKPKEFGRVILRPLEAMGQPMLQPNGPNGWNEAPESWITPSGIAARVRWASTLAQARAQNRDPRVFLDQTLGELASPLLTFAVGGSETKQEGVALVLASPEFNRR